jgi:hypothetical protein
MEHPRFFKGEWVEHKNGGIYRILHTPTELRIEHDNVPAYAYTDGKFIWVRPQSEMEDGRFVLIEGGA